jgi:ABC-2 type transport system ATP-binding protein
VKRRRSREVLRSVNVSLDVGVLGLLGPNGAGKTTLLSILATQALATAGVVTLLDEPIDRRTSERSLRAVRARIGYLPQRVPMLPWFTAIESITYAGWVKGMTAGAARARGWQLLEELELADRGTARMRSLSGGMVQRVGIAQALVHDPDVVLLDEPTAGLDPRQRVVFRRVVQRVGARAAVVLATHLVDDVGSACDRVAVLHEGALRFDGTPAGLVTAAQPGALGDTELERGFHSVIEAMDEPAAHRDVPAARQDR